MLEKGAMIIGWRTPINLVRSIGRNLWWIFHGKKFYATPEEISKRSNICENCIFFDNSSRQCLDCTCYVDLKTQLKSERCPQDFW